MDLVVSGGQSGVDRAALDAAIAVGIPYGGWCPAGGIAEDFQTSPGLLAVYPDLRQTPSVDSSQRTEWNVRDADATIVLLPGTALSPGSLLTVTFARNMGRPLLKLNPFEPDAPAAAVAFIDEAFTGGRLNVAGPRESQAPGIYLAARQLLEKALSPIRPRQ